MSQVQGRYFTAKLSWPVCNYAEVKEEKQRIEKERCVRDEEQEEKTHEDE